MKRSKVNYWVDMFIGAALVVSALSGLVFLLPVGNAAVLGVSYRTWDTIHTWSSLAMIGGAGAHLLLHWKWLVMMTKRMVVPERRSGTGAASGSRRGLTRRRFIRLGLGAAAAATIAAAYAAVAGPEASDGGGEGAVTGSSSDSQTAPFSGAQPEKARTDDAAPDPEPSQTSGASQSEDVSSASSPDETGAAQERVGSGAASVEAESGPAAAEAEQADSRSAEADEPQQQDLGVACPSGLVNDPFPGRCRRYTDEDGDGICDLSVLGSGPFRPTT